MIPENIIAAWRAVAPWPQGVQVEQDLILSRALVELFRIEELAARLAFRGGTALNKLYLRPPARYSEDIDLVQLRPEPIGATLDMIRVALGPWLGEPRRKLKRGGVHLFYRFESESDPPVPMRLKIEINTREHYTELGYAQVPLRVASPWFSGEALVTTYRIDELLGTKLRALYQRKKARDLFDLWYSLGQGIVEPEAMIQCFTRCMRESEAAITRAQFEANLDAKVAARDFGDDILPLLRHGIRWNLAEAADVVRRRVIEKLPGDPWRGGGG